MVRYQCPDCSYIYDEVIGEVHEGFPPNTLWAQIPEDWACPDCAVRDKPDFIPLGSDELREQAGPQSGSGAER